MKENIEEDIQIKNLNILVENCSDQALLFIINHASNELLLRMTKEKENNQ